MRHALIHDDTAYWLAPDNALMATDLDPDSNTPLWEQAHRADPATESQPDLLLAIHDALIAAQSPPSVVTADQVLAPTGVHLGWLVRDRSGRDLARYDRLDLATGAARDCEGTIHAWGRIGAGPVGWHQITPPSPPRPRAPARPTGQGPTQPATVSTSRR